MINQQVLALVGDSGPTKKGRVKHQVLIYFLEHPMKNSDLEFSEICGAHLDYVDPNYEVKVDLPLVVRHNGALHSNEDIAKRGVKSTIEIHPKFHPRLETWIRDRNQLILNINIIVNYMTAVMHRSVTLNDTFALLPPFLHELMEFETSMHYCEWMYKCRKQDQTLTDAQVAEFKELHTDAFKILRVMHLNKLTQ